MKAWVSGSQPGVDALELTEVPVPQPAAGELLVEVSGAALNHSDLLMIDDKYQVRPERPFTPGQEISGTVVAAGPQTHTSVGTHVATKVYWGGFAERAIVREDMAFEAPEGIALASTAALPVVYTTAAVALTEATEVLPNETLLIHGAAGGVGLASVQVGKALGASVIGTASSDSRRSLVASAGADHVLDSQRSDLVDVIMELTDGRGVDVVVDPVGGDTALGSLRSLAWRGRLLVIGFASGTIPQLPANRILLKAASVIGVYWNHDVDPDMVRRAQQRMLDWARDGAIRPHVDDRWGLADLGAALVAMRERQTVGKVVLRVGDER